MRRLSLFIALPAVGLLAGVCLAQGDEPADQPQVRQLRPDVFVVGGDGPTTRPDEQTDWPDQPDPDGQDGDDMDDDNGAEASPMQRLAGVPTTQPRAATTQPDTTADVELVQRAPLRLKLGRYEQAEQDFRELGKLEPHRLSAVVGLAEIYRRTGRYDEAAKALEEIDEAGRTSADWRLAKAELLAVRGQYEDALKLSEAVLAEDESNLHARWLTGRQLETLGRIEQAKEVYKPADAMTSRKVPPDAASMTRAGQILDRYSRLISKPVSYGTRILQDLYQDAYEKVDRQYWPARVASGHLLLAGYKTGEAAADFAAALKINPHAYEANLGLGWAHLEGWRFEQVDAQIAAAKKVNPKDPAVHELQAALHMMERKFADAAKAAQAGLDVNPRHLRCLGLLAAAHIRMGDDARVAELTRAAEAINPAPAEFFAIIAEWQSAGRQFDSAEASFKKAIEQAPWDPNPMTSLGMMYMQTGHETEAAAILEKAFAIDRYNRRSYNTLQLLDQLVAFDTLESENFIIKFNRATDALLGPYFRDYLESIHAELARDYDIELPRKTIVELFPTHPQFSVRTTGRPWIPTVGACTGWVIAIYSPRDMVGKTNPRTGEPMGFNWARVLRHEFTHTVTLAATENRIPHWFTEGLAVHQEQHPRQWEWVGMLTMALRQGQLFDVDKIDWGFIRPRRPTDRQLAYAQSEWMVEFIIEQYGYGRINELLRAFREHKTQAQAIKDVLGVSEAEFSRLFRQWAHGQVKDEWRMPADRILTLPQAQRAVRDKPDDDDAQADLAVAAFHARRAKEAEQAARKALAINPNNTTALAVLGTILAANEQTWNQAKDLLLRLSELDPTNAAAPKLLAQRALKEERRDLAVFWFNRLKLASPYDPMSYTGLAGIYLDSKQYDKALPELAELARREQSNPQYALKMAELYTLLGKPDQAVVWLEQAMHIDPFKPEVHKDLAVAYLAVDRPDQAIHEMKVAIQLDPGNAGYWARLAFIYDANGKGELAIKAAEFSVRLDPTSPARDLLRHGGASGGGPASAPPPRRPEPEPPITIDLPVEAVD